MTVHDTTPHFLTLFDTTQGGSDAEKLRRFWTEWC